MNRKQLKEKHLELNEYQPFTEKENNRFNKKDKSMIRNIQILNNFNKKQAIVLLKKYKSTPKEALKTIAKKYRSRLKKYSSPQKPEIRGHFKESSKHKKPEYKTTKILQSSREKLKEYLKEPKNKRSANYSKVQKASKKYIDASEYELRYGVNSKKARAYRERIGLNTKYEGRVIK